MTPLRIVAFFDGRRGHEKQTQGVLDALERLTPVQVERRRTPDRAVGTVVRDWADYLRNWIVARNREKIGQGVDLIIGTGSYTHLPMLLLKRDTGARAVTCMTPDPFLKREFDLCFVPSHDRQQPAGNIFVTIGPPSAVSFQDTHDPQRGLILVGGVDRKRHKWRSETVMTQIRSVLEKEPSLKWTIASSPRTPADTIRLLETLASEMGDVEFFSSEQTPAGWIEKQYAQNLTVWVTADSMSMIFEALTAGCRVGILPVEGKPKNAKLQKSLEYLIESKQAASFEKWLAGIEPMTRGEAPDEASRCAREILTRWWPERLR